MEFKFVRAEFYHGATNSYEDNVYILPAEASDLEVDNYIYPDFDVFVENVEKEYPDACSEDCHWDWYEIDVEELRAWCIATAADDDEASKMYYEYCAAAGIPTSRRKYHVRVSYDFEVAAHTEAEAREIVLKQLCSGLMDSDDFAVMEV